MPQRCLRCFQLYGAFTNHVHVPYIFPQALQSAKTTPTADAFHPNIFFQKMIGEYHLLFLDVAGQKPTYLLL